MLLRVFVLLRPSNVILLQTKYSTCAPWIDFIRTISMFVCIFGSSLGGECSMHDDDEHDIELNKWGFFYFLRDLT